MSTSTGPEIEKAYQRFSRRARKYDKYKFIGNTLFFGTYFIGAALMAVAMLLSEEASIFESPYFLYFVLGVSLLLVSYPFKWGVRKKTESYRMPSEHRLFLRVYSALENLDSFSNTDLQSDRNRSKEEVRQILDGVKGWKVSGLKLMKQAVGKHVIPFKQNLENKLLPAVEEGDETNLKKSHDFLVSFARYLINENPTVEDIDDLNDTLAAITTIPSEKPVGIRERFSRGKAGPVLALASCCLAGFVAFYVGYYVLGVPIESAYAVGFGLAGVLVGGYLNYARK